jgi:uncharacterized membrane protein YsdA (DUF1294 family)
MNPLLLIAGIYGFISAITFILYVRDKRAARLGARRTPEATLHLWELCGGWPGAFVAQRCIRHKNAKLSYQVVYWAIVALHAAAWAGLWWSNHSH